MRRHLLLYLLLLFPLCLKAQTYHLITQTNGTQTFPNNTATVSPVNGACPTTPVPSVCGITGYAIGCGTNNGFDYSFVNPISHVRIRAVGIDQGEFLVLTLNNSKYMINLAELSSCPANCSLPISYTIQNGEVGSTVPSGGNGEGVTVDVIPGFQIYEIDISNNNLQQGLGGFVYQLEVVNDTCGANTLVATANSPCVGQSLNFSATNAPAGVTAYNWSGPLSFSSSQQNPAIANATQAHTASPYYVTATRGACNYTKEVKVVVKGNPTVTTVSSSPAAPCPGQNVSLQATADSAGSTYAWTGPNSYSSNQQNPTVTNTSFQSQGTYTVVATKNGCASAPASTTVTLAPLGVTPTASNDGPVCPGKTVNLYASAVPDPNATYLWIGPNSFSTTTKDPVLTNVAYTDSGKYYVVSVSNGCQSPPDSTTVVIAPLAQTPEADSAIVVCPGTPLDLKASTIAGATYSWTGPIFPTPSPMQNPSVPNAHAGFAGKYFVTATDTANVQYPTIPNATSILAGKYYVRANVGGCISLADTTIVVVEITTPTPEAGSNGPVCEGTDLQLTASAIANASYKWKGPDNYSSTAQNPARPGAQPAISGSYIVEANVDGCISIPDTVTVTVKPAPTVAIQGDTLLCESETLNLTALSPQEPVSYQWTLPNGTAFIEKNLSVAGVDAGASGKYSVYVNHDGCQSLTPGVIDVRVKPLPAIPTASNNSSTKDSARKIGQEIKLFGNNTTTGVTYSWTGPNGFTSNAQNPVIKDISKLYEGKYTLTTMLDGCATEVSTEVFVSNRNFVILYPNPNDGIFTLKASLGKDQVADLFIVNAVGQIVYRDKVEVKGKLLLKEFSLGANLSNGVYLLHIPLEKDDDIDLRFVIKR
ncbi:MAG: hypothetical protein K0R82_1151 [Flavipsychrobacter sp.]|nr:hypothetical protein [Flavipsychrobacter sp.]